MITRNNALTASTLVAGVAFAGPALATAQGNSTTAPANPSTAQSTATKSTTTPSVAWVGLQAVTADGRALGTISKIVAKAGDAGTPMLIVRSPLDAQVFSIPAGIAELKGSVVHLGAMASDLQKRSS
jgi:hypothetical protein